MRTFIIPALVVFGALAVNQAEASIHSRRASHPKRSACQAAPGSRSSVQIQDVQVPTTMIERVPIQRVQIAPVTVPARMTLTPVRVTAVVVQPVVNPAAVQVQRPNVPSVTVQSVSGSTQRPGASAPSGSGSFPSDRTTWDLPVSLTIAPTPAAQPRSFSLDSLDLASGLTMAPPQGSAQGTNVSRGSAATPKLREYGGKSIELWTTPAPAVDDDEL